MDEAHRMKRPRTFALSAILGFIIAIAVSAAFAKLNHRLEALESAVTENESALDAVRSGVDEVRDEMHTLQRAVADNEAAIDELRSDVDELIHRR
jgi:chromosome segregation ATPase